MISIHHDVDVRRIGRIRSPASGDSPRHQAREHPAGGGVVVDRWEAGEADGNMA